MNNFRCEVCGEVNGSIMIHARSSKFVCIKCHGVLEREYANKPAPDKPEMFECDCCSGYFQAGELTKHCEVELCSECLEKLDETDNAREYYEEIMENEYK